MRYTLQIHVYFTLLYYTVLVVQARNDDDCDALGTLSSQFIDVCQTSRTPSCIGTVGLCYDVELAYLSCAGYVACATVASARRRFCDIRMVW